ncbi:unnamed protein product [Vitrella brassicaformis CCMP3155]|uniref:tRNA (guanine(46)-N(7))-methyltransferase n=2 Tax=Vitrella brassicaformis TaxID=1169539 RepID=A0A0G4E9Z1_VITBC|nr:unnamed protein product [Vitrella brassicaformis CCMP3155]|eukprot:CEL92745.1 unnamed protein product [Vitrella brassicaformis CCMP3155]
MSASDDSTQQPPLKTARLAMDQQVATKERAPDQQQQQTIEEEDESDSMDGDDDDEQMEEGGQPSGRQGGKRSRGKFRRPRNHVNPFSPFHQRPVDLEDRWPEKVFEKPSLPLHVDLGSAYGHFCMAMAEKYPSHNYLGVEIRTKVVEHAISQRDKAGQRNAHFIGCNVNVNLDRILTDIEAFSPPSPHPLPPSIATHPKCTTNDKTAVEQPAAGARGGVECVTIQFPDPHFKKRHHKRRMVNQQLVDIIGRHLVVGGRLILQSDIFEVAVEMRQLFDAHPAFVDTHAADDWQGQPDQNPLGVATEREKGRIANNEPVYRAVFYRVPYDEPGHDAATGGGREAEGDNWGEGD